MAFLSFTVWCQKDVVLNHPHCSKWAVVSRCNELVCFNVCYANLIDKNLVNCDVLNFDA